jgi:hypothetical protein
MGLAFFYALYKLERVNRQCLMAEVLASKSLVFEYS